MVPARSRASKTAFLDAASAPSWPDGSQHANSRRSSASDSESDKHDVSCLERRRDGRPSSAISVEECMWRLPEIEVVFVVRGAVLIGAGDGDRIPCEFYGSVSY